MGWNDNLKNATTDDGYIFSYTYEDDSLLLQEIIEKVNRKPSVEAREIFTKIAEENNFGKKKINYKLRDWLFSRQRYWGEPIPVIHLDHADLKQLPHISDISEATDVNLAYILKRPAMDGENISGCTCNSGKVRELVIGGKIFSKIYD